MSPHESLLQESQEKLSQVLKPYQQETSHRLKMVELVRECIQSIEKDDYFRLDELLTGNTGKVLQEESDFEECQLVFKQLLEYAEEKVDQYRIEFIDDMKSLSAEASLPIEVDFPRFSVLKGIDGVVDFAGRTTTINDKKLKSIDPKKVVAFALKFKKRLYDRTFDPQRFIDDLFSSYSKILAISGSTLGELIPIKQFYLEYVISQQSKQFYMDMDKGKFKGYNIEQFTVDLWCYFQAGTGGTSEGCSLALRPGRNNSLWLIDSDGEKRQITSISFQKSR